MGHSGKDSNRTDRSAEGEPPPRFADDRFYRALASQHRRRVLQYLLEENDSTVEEIATVLSGWEATTTATMQTPADRSEVLIDLTHNHLPRLADAGLVAYDPDTGSVRLESLHPQVEGLIRRSAGAGRSGHS